jgi:hypothetical protein
MVFIPDVSHYSSADVDTELVRTEPTLDLMTLVYHRCSAQRFQKLPK